VSTFRLEMENFNGTNFESWKLKIDDLLIDQHLWVAIYGTKLVGMKDEECVVLERNARTFIKLYLVDSVLVNISGKKTPTTL